MSDRFTLALLEQQVSDREPIDWNDVLEGPLSADDLRDVEFLRLVDELARANAEFQTGIEDEIDKTLTAWGRYRLEQKVGQGAFGSVYRGWDPVLEMPVAIKILHRQFSAEHLKARLLREGRALAQVTHPNVVRVLNVEQHDDRLGLVMEFLRGETMDARIAAHGLLNDREATVIGEYVCRALAAVHVVGLVHRDVKARNIVREQTGRIVLMDFGAGSRAASADASAEGTPLYMAPEVLNGAPATVASDVYSVGVLLFFLVSRRYPYEAETVEELRQDHAEGRAESLMTLRPDLPPAFTKVIDRAVAHDAHVRYRTPAALMQALLEARDTRRPWIRYLITTGSIAAGATVSITCAGMISTLAFNTTLKRSAYATDSIADWFVLGGRSLFLPMILSLLSVGAIGLGIALRKVLVQTSPRLAAMERAFVQRCRSIGARWSLGDLDTSSCWLILLTTFGIGVAWVYGAPLFSALASDISTTSADVLALLSPPSGVYRTNFRMIGSIVAAVSLAGWFALARTAAARNVHLPRWLTVTEISALVLLCGSMQVPYRLTRDIATFPFPVVRWGTQRCYVFGERGDDALLFCPSMMPRHQSIKKSQEQIERLNDRESPFAVFAPTIPSKPH